MNNILTIDVEDWFHTTAMEPFVGPSRWEAAESRVVYNTLTLLDILETAGTRATFFILGWVAERYPGLVREIDARGHEVASHGYRHRLIYQLSPETFRDYVRRAKQVLEDLTGKAVLGYRAASFSVVPGTLWALDVIKEAGFSYDSSMFPIRHDIYGVNGFPRHPFVHANGLIEIPASTVTLLRQNIPLAGGGYFRLYPYWLTKQGIRSLNRMGQPAVVYLHPWELDPDCPRIKEADWRTRFRQYVNLGKTKQRCDRLLADFAFSTVKEYLRLGGF